MIPRAAITGWRGRAPWPTDAQVEQDLVLSRALVELFGNPLVGETLAFRGGTTLHKLFLPSPGRYSEDIDLVQVRPGAIGPTLDAIRSVLDPWLQEPTRKRSADGVRLVYRFDTTARPTQRLRLKLEINTREHASVLGLHGREFAVDSSWYSGKASVRTYALEELLATKLRALYQRRKGRDLFDLWLVLVSQPVEDEKVLACFGHCMKASGASVSRAEFEANLDTKLRVPAFLEDLAPLLPAATSYDVSVAGSLVLDRLVSKLRGEPWRGPGRR